MQTAHLLAPAILIEYGTGVTYTKLKMDEEKRRFAISADIQNILPAFCEVQRNLESRLDILQKESRYSSRKSN